MKKIFQQFGGTACLSPRRGGGGGAVYENSVGTQTVIYGCEVTLGPEDGFVSRSDGPEAQHGDEAVTREHPDDYLKGVDRAHAIIRARSGVVGDPSVASMSTLSPSSSYYNLSHDTPHRSIQGSPPHLEPPDSSRLNSSRSTEPTVVNKNEPREAIEENAYEEARQYVRDMDLSCASPAKIKAVTSERSFKGRTVLHELSREGDHSTIAKLAGAGANLNVKSSDGRTPLHTAIENDDIETVKALLEAGADGRVVDESSGASPFLIAVRWAGQDVIEHIAKAYPKQVHQSDRHRSTALHRATRFRDKQILSLLISIGARVNAQDIRGRTPLHTAAMFGMVDNAKVLLENGGDLTIADYQDETPINLAEDENQPQIIALYNEFGAAE